MCLHVSIASDFPAFADQFKIVSVFVNLIVCQFSEIKSCLMDSTFCSAFGKCVGYLKHINDIYYQHRSYHHILNNHHQACKWHQLDSILFHYLRDTNTQRQINRYCWHQRTTHRSLRGSQFSVEASFLCSVNILPARVEIAFFYLASSNVAGCREMCGVWGDANGTYLPKSRTKKKKKKKKQERTSYHHA